jgi:hypothetical protein
VAVVVGLVVAEVVALDLDVLAAVSGSGGVPAAVVADLVAVVAPLALWSRWSPSSPRWSRT